MDAIEQFKKAIEESNKDPFSSEKFRAIGEAHALAEQSGSEFYEEVFGTAGKVQFSLAFQLYNLGISPLKIRGMKGLRVLDLGCGKEGKLVYFLRDNGIRAEGIDGDLERETPFLMRGDVGGFGKPNEKIQRKNRYYDYVFTHNCHSLKLGLSSYYGKQPATDQIVKSVGIFEEVFRVLKPRSNCVGGEFACFPQLDRIDILKCSIGGPKFSATHEKGTPDSPLYEFMEELDYFGEDPLISFVNLFYGVVPQTGHRTIFTKE